MRSAHYSLFALLMLCYVQTGFSQQQRGDVEAQLTGYYFTTVGTEFSSSSGSINAKLGYYFSDHLEIGFGPTFTVSSSTVLKQTGTFTYEKETETTTDVGTSAFATYSFLAGGAKTVPYFGAQYFKQSFKRPISEDRGTAGIYAGVKFFFTKKTAFDFGGNYLFSLNQDAEGGLLLFAAGLSFLF